MSEKTEKELLENILAELEYQKKYNINQAENILIPQLRMLKRISTWISIIGILLIGGIILVII